jgi:hypothetical protein
MPANSRWDLIQGLKGYYFALRGKYILLHVHFCDFNYFSCLETQFVIGSEFWELNLPRIIFLLIFKYILGRMLKKNNWNIPELTLFC